MQKTTPIEVIVLAMALNHARAALGVLDRSEECPEIAAQLDLAVSRLAEELATRESETQQTEHPHLSRGHLRLATG